MPPIFNLIISESVLSLSSSRKGLEIIVDAIFSGIKSRSSVTVTVFKAESMPSEVNNLTNGISFIMESGILSVTSDGTINPYLLII